MKLEAQALSLLALLTGCAGTVATARTAPVTVAPTTTRMTATTQAPTPDAISATLPAAVRLFADEHVTGAMALFDTRDGKLLCSDPAKCEAGYLPASTFKIANTIIALETGVVSDAESPLP